MIKRKIAECKHAGKAKDDGNVVVFSELDFEEHLNGRKYARMLKIV